jgi:hypothetical protein
MWQTAEFEPAENWSGQCAEIAQNTPKGHVPDEKTDNVCPHSENQKIAQ